jgi:hypothetical protein
MADDAGEEAMRYAKDQSVDSLFPYEQGVPTFEDQQTSPDYSEEAIPERDPAYRLCEGTLSESQTVEYLPPAERLALARQLEELGMNPARAALVANL